MTFSGLGFNLHHFRGGALAVAIIITAPTVVHADSAQFANFAGNWTGNGTISIADGGTERIRCRGTYTVNGSGNNLHQVLRCASDSYKFELTSDVEASGSNLSGSWNEASRGVNGSIQGKISNGEISALVQTNGYAATFNVVTRGNKQSVNISSKGELRGVNITLARSN